MASHSFGYEKEIVAQNYSKYRPTYHIELYDQIIEYLEQGVDEKGRRRLAVDIACGCGQSTVPLARYFERVIGIDSSEAQVNEARKGFSAEYPNVEYRVGSAEDLRSILEDETVDLITVGMALHWFDFVRFYQECVRVLKPGGVLAVYSFKIPPQCEKSEANETLQEILHGTRGLANYAPKQFDHYYNDYQEPFELVKQFLGKCVRMEAKTLRCEYSLSDLLNFFSTLPEYHAYKVDHPEDDDSIHEIFQELQNILGVNSFEDKFGYALFKMFLFMGRKISNHPPSTQK